MAELSNLVGRLVALCALSAAAGCLKDRGAVRLLCALAAALVIARALAALTGRVG